MARNEVTKDERKEKKDTNKHVDIMGAGYTLAILHMP